MTIRAPLQALAIRHAEQLEGMRESGFRAGLRELGRKLDSAYEEITRHIESGLPGTRAEEWLLDNRHVIDEALEQVGETLSPGYLRRLPRARAVDGASTPIRVRELAGALVETGAKPIDPDWLERTVEQYQSRAVLTIGELWALPAFFRLALLEGLLCDACFCLHLDQAAAEDSGEEEVRVAEIAGAIISLRSLAAHDWKVSFERLCKTDAILRRDPAGAYATMDFESRNRYRDVIEELAHGSALSETEIAERILSCCNEPNRDDARTSHVGYFLLGGGRSVLERKLGFRPSMRHRALRWANRRPERVYFGLLVLFSLPLLAVLIAVLTRSGASPAMTAGVSLLATVPVAGFAVALLNGLVTWLIPPRPLAKMDFEAGIPSDCRSIVVVPVLLADAGDVDQVFERLEINYLNNEDPALGFAVLGDLADADEKVGEGDGSLLARAAEATGALNQRYGKSEGAGPFLFLNRDRRWNPAEGRWMGWERKRGKLMEFHRLLAGDEETDYTTRAGNTDLLRDVRFVITLDADTLMPPGAARNLVGAIAHPLSQAVPAGKPGLLRHGYSILQPRLEIDPDSTQATRFTRVFAGDTSLDLYTHAASDVYHDLFGQGIYAGKGIYDWNAFEYVLASRVPDNALLSHDLIEGVHARAGLLSDVVLLEQFPPNTLAFMRRLHRWVRGDWQLLPWLGRWVPVAGHRREPNPLSPIHQWKIVDNLRRSLQPPVVLALLLLAWSGRLPGPDWAWTLLFAGLLASPVISELLDIAGRGLVRPATLARRLKTAPPALAARLEHWLLNLVLLPYQSHVLLDAVARTLFRLLVTRRHLLEWVTAARVHKRFGTGMKASLLWREMWVSPALAVLAAAGIIALNPAALGAAAPLLLAWLSAPAIVGWYDRPPARLRPELPEDAIRRLRGVARRTWLFFDRFTGPDDHWLPPDSFQEEPAMMLARRTSPTNMGMALVSALAAHDMGYLDTAALAGWLRNTLERMHDLPRYRGHWLNWYSTRDMRPLDPRYVSTVDSGNLAACLLTLARGLEAIADAPADGGRLVRGLVDTLRVLRETVPAGGGVLRGEIERLCRELERSSAASPDARPKALRMERIDRLGEHLLRIVEDDEIEIGGEAFAQLRTWQEEVERQAARALRFFDRGVPADEAARLGEELRALARVADQAVAEMEFGFLYDDSRHLFHIGYNVGGGTPDPNYYDLLASEARLASFLAIAKGEVPAAHWMRLGRPFRRMGKATVLMSWGATLFEYLMPRLFTATGEDSLLGRACRTAIDAHRAFARGFGLPWGVSESGYSQMDDHHQYQYRAFGVPGIGFRRDLGDRLVIAPYASMMALAFDPAAVIRNLEHLESYGALGQYGLFEAIDFGRTYKAGARRARMVRSYMSHHQGMVMLSIVNFLERDVMVRRFHSDPRVAGVSMLLHERLPRSPPKLKARERPIRGKLFKIEAGPETWTLQAGGKIPQHNLLSNGHYSLFLNAEGGGGSLWNGIALTRWQSDATTNERGPWFYVKDLDAGHIFSTTYDPLGGEAGDCSAEFGPHIAEFHQRQRDLQCRMKVAVSSQHDIEARKLVIRNEGNRPRRLMIAAYAEVALAPPEDFERHPAFARLFVESDCLEGESILLFRRRPRGGAEKPVYLAHTVLATPGLKYRFGFETERGRFIGRGRDHLAPRALDAGLDGLSGSRGAVLDPVIGSAIELTLPAYGQAEIGWLTSVGRSREDVLSKLRAYRSMPRVDWVFEQAYMQTGQELHNLEIDPGAVREMAELLSAVLSPARELRRVGQAHSPAHSPVQLALWARGISGDRPILLVLVRAVQDVGMLEPLLQAHTLWAGRQAGIDLVLIDDASAGYVREARDRLHDLAEAVRARTNRRLTGSVTIVPGRDLDPGERELLLAAAHVVLDTGEGAFRRQLRRHSRNWLPPLIPVPSAERGELTTTPLSEPRNLRFDNGIGGFTDDGREYVIRVDPGRPPPAPWSNVLANPHFGCLVTETGGGCTWADNSAELRLTPWSNDPVSDGRGEALYLRDEETGEVWTPTARPLPADGPYQVAHGAGYSEFRHHGHGLEQRLRVHVDPDAPVKLSRLSLTNTCAWTRRITVTCYTEWVLGGTRARCAAHIASELDRDTNTLLARNRFDRLAGTGTAFLGASRAPHGVTADRAEFLGRGGRARIPAALDCIGLSDMVRPDDDPCAAYQIHLNLPPGETRQVHFMLGWGRDREQAVALARRFRDEGELEASWHRLQKQWDEILDTVRVETPEPAMDLLLNRWLLYQTLSSRLWARGGYYQPSGAYGFRDQLQDVMALAWSAPALTREQILKAASRQFADGDVLHWWHEDPLRGVRTRYSDDLLWLPYVTAQYLESTGDHAILHESVPYLEGPVLEPDESEHYREFAPGERTGSLYDHCCRALERAGTVGPHGLPTIGGGDWNDGFNRVSTTGRGESVWLAWFLARTYRDFVPWCEHMGDSSRAQHYRRLADHLVQRIEETAWDGEWYRRAYFDDGTPLGSRDNDECRIDLIAQVWSVLAADAPTERARQAMKSVWRHLVRKDERLILLLTPPFDRGAQDPGYIKGYPPGIRENGAQYTHAATWAVWAAAELGDGDGAMELFRLINPILRTTNREDAERYRVEPYVLAGDVYSVPPHTGRGGWSWYTGAAGWLYRAGLEALLGLRLHGGELEIDPCLPADWPGYRARIRRGESSYRIEVEKPAGLERGRVEITLDGKRLEGNRVPLADDGKTHEVRVRMFGSKH